MNAGVPRRLSHTEEVGVTCNYVSFQFLDFALIDLK